MFEKSYSDWLGQQTEEATGERRRKLKEHGHAEMMFLERVWWPALGNFDYLQPEYEVNDFRDGVRFLDFAYLRPPHKVCIEVDSFGHHHRNLDRYTFADRLLRQNHLVMDDWKVLRFSYDIIKDAPRQYQQLVQQWIGKFYGVDRKIEQGLTIQQSAVLRFTLKEQKAVKPEDVAKELNVCTHTARIILKDLVELKLLEPASGVVRVRAYKIANIYKN
ncbi:hypothetical protein SY83_07535 [Paenibacillus swuensis]|uniref:DNA-binding response regulator n=1 Tax=Paenibacillus swuensis TaxID=1178515 RepID=A0A172TH79_9BACL|nr:helix-turn-helix domain-containing protein [Paenibacillus swuensis]ANE46143.1 hypothetical protein SY83_07535 [Paenibacillus swuensis]